MKLETKAKFLSLIPVMILSACGGGANNIESSSSGSGDSGTTTSTSSQTFTGLKINVPSSLSLTDGDFFDPAQLIIQLVDSSGLTEVTDISNTVVTVDGTTYTGSPIEVHAPSATVTVTYKKEGQNELSNQMVLNVKEKDVPKKVKVIVMAGQSNMVGHSLVDRMKETMSEETIYKYKAGFDNVLIYNSCNPYSSDVTKVNATSDFVPVKAGMGASQTLQRLGQMAALVQNLD